MGRLDRFIPMMAHRAAMIIHHTFIIVSLHAAPHPQPFQIREEGLRLPPPANVRLGHAGGFAGRERG